MRRRPSIVVVAAVFEGALLLAALGLGWWLDVPAFGRARFGPGAVGIGVGCGAVLLAALLPGMASDWPPLARLAEIARGFVRAWFADAGAFEIVAVSAMAGVAEEALFRGVVQAALAGPWGTVGAVLAASALFGAAHAVTVTYALVVAGVGVVLGGVFAATGDLAAPIVAHTLYDALALAWLVREARREPGLPEPRVAPGTETT